MNIYLGDIYEINIFFSNEWADFCIDGFSYFWYYNSPVLYSVTARREKFMNSEDDMYSVWGLDGENCYAVYFLNISLTVPMQMLIEKGQASVRVMWERDTAAQRRPILSLSSAWSVQQKLWGQ